MALEIAADGCTNRWKKIAFANLCEQPEPFKLFFHGIFKFNGAQLDTSLLQGVIQLSDTIGRRTSTLVTGSPATTS